MIIIVVTVGAIANHLGRAFFLLTTRARTFNVCVPMRIHQEMPDAGHQIPGMSAAGTVRVRVVSAAHAQFDRRGADLHARIVITLREALLGFSRTGPLLTMISGAVFSEFVRWVFIAVVTSLILKTSYDAFLR